MSCDFLEIFIERGFLFQCTNIEGLKSFLNSQKKTSAYIGFDCTAQSLHIGSLLQIMILRLLQRCNIKPIIILGGATTRIGDPSGRDKSRKMLTEEDINKNMLSIKKVLEKFITFGDAENEAILVNNNDWLKDIKYIDFLSDIGSFFSVNRMLSFESLKRRLSGESTLSFLEFNYMILQAYDFIQLFNKYNCQIQLGGSDQWGNIINGIELGNRLGIKKELFGLTTPLITNSSGEKMGKTAKGAVWLTKEDFSSYDYWQFWRNTDDKDVIKFLYLFTEIPVSEIKKLEDLKGSDINQAKIILANEACKLCHGAEEALLAEKSSKEIFQNKGIGESLISINLSKEKLEKGIPVFKIILETGLVNSGKEARRLILGGGGRLNGKKISNPEEILSFNDFKDNTLKISAGKKKHAIVKLTD